MAKHTAGPWFPTKQYDWSVLCNVGRAWNICTKLPLSELGDIDADANLMAAAPDMHRALEVIVSTLDALDEFDNLRHIARAALAKAEGTPL